MSWDKEQFLFAGEIVKKKLNHLCFCPVSLVPGGYSEDPAGTSSHVGVGTHPNTEENVQDIQVLLVLNLLLLFLVLQGCLPFLNDLGCVVVGHLAGPQEATAMRGEPVDEVIMVLERVDTLLNQQSESGDCPVVVIVPAQQKW